MPVALGGVAALLGSIGGGLGGLLLKGALIAGGIAAQLLLAPKPKEPPRPDDLRNTKESEEGPGLIAFGRVEVEGSVVFGDTSKYDLYRVILHAFGPLDAVEEYYYDGHAVVVDRNGLVSSPPYVSSRSVRSHLRLYTQPGDGGETAWPLLMDAFPKRWTGDHRARGNAQTLLHFVSPGAADSRFGKLLTGGLKPVRLRARFQRPYDPRDGQSRWTMNAALIIYHYRRQLPGAGEEVFDEVGIGQRADEADALVPTIGGTRPRAQLSGGGEAAVDSDFLLKLMECAGLEEVQTVDGKVSLRWLEDAPAAEVYLRERHIVEQRIQKGPVGAERPNVCRVKYLSAERQYTVAEIPLQVFDTPDGSYSGPAWARVQDEVDLYGEQEVELDLRYCPHPGQALTIARRLFHMRRAWSGDLTTTLAGLRLYGRRTIDVDVSDIGPDEGPLKVRARITEGILVQDTDDRAEVQVPIAIIPDILFTSWKVSRDEVEGPPELDRPVYDPELPTPAPPTSISAAVLPGSVHELRVQTDVPHGEDVEAMEVNFRSYDAAGNPDLWERMEERGLRLGTAPGDYRGRRVDARVRVYNDKDESSDFSGIFSVASVAINNDPPGAPFVQVKAVERDPFIDADILLTAPPSASVVRQVWVAEPRQNATISGVRSGAFDVRPGQMTTVTIRDVVGTVDVESWVTTTNGTEGPHTSVPFTGKTPSGP